MGVQVKTMEDRKAGQAMWRGALCKCPNCGQGHMFRAYLKVADTCDVCGEELSHHRADDFPPYIAIMIVGHLLVGLMLHMEMTWHVNPAVYLYTLVPLAIVLPLAILPSIKGAIVGMQWAARMHGFNPAHQD
ncbi:MAG: hypothetical protein JWR51_1797 [Devosia sp.]|uniref:DUF983 domain-containing protein n=1 Tax=Devosia sp. TaxID=1871048 RepID=UPI002601E4C5|nr:DUF983 domain-containing protein [Devosia sp.]MDB5528694.1 hypothetical protein [Devosia sp.]